MGINQSLHETHEILQRSYAATLFSRKAQQKKKDEVEVEQFADKSCQMMQRELDADNVRFNDITIPRNAESNDAKCESCSDYNSIADYMCFKCEEYLCIMCEKSHGRWCSDFDTTKWIKADFLDLIKEEGRREKIMQTNISLCNQINIKHDLDQMDCSVTGLSGIGDNGWVICDSFNFCIKLFDVNSTKIRRYIKFSSLPFDVTELSQTSTAPEKNTVKVTEWSQQYLVAVTFPRKQQIMVLNVKQNMTLRHKIIKIDKPCYRIDSCENKIFTLCDEKPSSLDFKYSVYMLSEDGDILKIIKTKISSHNPYFAVDANRIFLTDYSNFKVKCLDFEGNLLLKGNIKWSNPQGICIGEEGKVYYCSGSQIWTINYDSSLRRIVRKCLMSSLDVANGGVLCFHSDKLYVGSSGDSLLDNCIRVVRLV